MSCLQTMTCDVRDLFAKVYESRQDIGLCKDSTRLDFPRDSQAISRVPLVG